MAGSNIKRVGHWDWFLAGKKLRKERSRLSASGKGIFIFLIPPLREMVGGATKNLIVLPLTLASSSNQTHQASCF